MNARRIVIIRHAEKPIASRIDGVRASGRSDDASLTARGCQRAGALVAFFEHPTSPHIVRPDQLFAVRYDPGSVSTSRRSGQTARPLAERLGLACDRRFGEGQEALFGPAVLAADGQAVLVVWSHGHISKLAAVIAPGVRVPGEWPTDRFDLVWVFDRTGRRTVFTQVPQRLLAGDEDEPAPFDGEDG